MTPTSLQPIISVAALRAATDAWRSQGLSIALVPTMGALHRGHLSLVERARTRCDRTIVTIFVNPIQFGPGEDFDRYPRPESDDLARLEEVGCDVVFMPAAGELFPDGPDGLRTSVSVRGLDETLCGPHRPGHFTGVATIVTKLLMLTLPDVAIFGEKDYQQLQIIRTLVRDLNIRAEVESAPTVREPDGLAMSSRNAYLPPELRARAPRLYQTLQETAMRLSGGESARPAIDAAAASLAASGFVVDYVSLVDADSLQAIDRVDRPARLAAAARLGPTRLIDNVPVTPQGGVSA
jgi:pantoate--beta-alanine ligase